jgi:hypothetical protein
MSTFSRLILAAVVVYVLSLAGAMLAPSASPQSLQAAENSTPPAPPPRPTEPLPAVDPTPALFSRGPVVGFTLNIHHTSNPKEYYDAVDQIAAAGFNTIEVVTPAYQTNGESQEIYIEVGMGKCPERQFLVDLFRYAKEKKGLNTVLMPIVLFASPRGNEWRGKIQPEDWDPWWLSYHKMLDYFIGIANDSRVDMMMVGSELLSTETQEERWEQIIAETRTKFPGKLTYSTNWDHYEVPQFWGKLDVIGINGYWDLTTLAKSDPPKQQAINERWAEIRNKLLKFGEAKHTPIYLTEIGYPSLPWGLKDPWNYINSSGVKADHKTQEMAFLAFTTAWDDLAFRKPDLKKFGGVCFFKWDPTVHGGDDDTGYGVAGKPSLELLKKWIAKGRK